MNDCLTIRLAYNPGPVNQYKALEQPASMTSTSTGDTQEMRYRGELPAPALLVSYVYLAGFLKHRHRYHYRDWVLDSGAFSAHNSGEVISLKEYIETCKRLMDEDDKLTEIFALDVIGNHKASMRNCEQMWKQGVPAIPCFHRGSPWPDLKALAQDYPKIALGGVALLRGAEKMRFAEQAFNLVWPAKIHGFGFGSESQVLGLPWHSVDATSWEIGPCRFGRWNHFGQMSVRGSQQNLRAEVEWYLRLEQKAQFQWRREMAVLAARDAEKTVAPSVRLVGATSSVNSSKIASGLAAPTLRLAVQQSSDAQIARSGLETDSAPSTSPAVRLACCMSESEGGSWGARNMTQALGTEHYQRKTEGLTKLHE